MYPVLSLKCVSFGVVEYYSNHLHPPDETWLTSLQESSHVRARHYFTKNAAQSHMYFPNVARPITQL